MKLSKVHRVLIVISIIWVVSAQMIIDNQRAARGNVISQGIYNEYACKDKLLNGQLDVGEFNICSNKVHELQREVWKNGDDTFSYLERNLVVTIIPIACLWILPFIFNFLGFIFRWIKAGD